MKIVFDTNALLIPFQFGVNPYKGVKDLVPNAELITLKKCISELKQLKPEKWNDIVNLGLMNGLEIIDSGINGLSVDDIIVKFALQENTAVFTQDKLLKKKLLNNSLRLVVMRQQKRFVLIG